MHSEHSDAATVIIGCLVVEFAKRSRSYEGEISGFLVVKISTSLACYRSMQHSLVVKK